MTIAQQRRDAITEYRDYSSLSPLPSSPCRWTQSDLAYWEQFHCRNIAAHTYYTLHQGR